MTKLSTASFFLGTAISNPQPTSEDSQNKDRQNTEDSCLTPMNIIVQIFFIVLFLVQALLCALALGALSTAKLFSPTNPNPLPPKTYQTSCKDLNINEAIWLTFVGMALSCSLIVTNPKIVQLMSSLLSSGDNRSTMAQFSVIVLILLGTLPAWFWNCAILNKVLADGDCNILLTSPDSGIDTKIVQSELWFAIIYGVVNVTWCAYKIIFDFAGCCKTH